MKCEKYNWVKNSVQRIKGFSACTNVKVNSNVFLSIENSDWKDVLASNKE